VLGVSISTEAPVALIRSDTKLDLTVDVLVSTASFSNGSAVDETGRATLGTPDGIAVAPSLDGTEVVATDGTKLGLVVGALVTTDSSAEGSAVDETCRATLAVPDDGLVLGISVSKRVGSNVGAAVGASDGLRVDSDSPLNVGSNVGALLNSVVGGSLGSCASLW